MKINTVKHIVKKCNYTPITIYIPNNTHKILRKVAEKNNETLKLFIENQLIILSKTIK